MRLIILLAAGATLIASPAIAADALKFGPAPSWVIPQQFPQISSKAADAPLAVLLNDSQARIEPGRLTDFTEVVMKIQTADGLAVGNISLPWQPATDTITINKLHIIRDGKVIDVLGSGQTFTVLRRETNLDAATLDGSLTASIQPEGLRVGDIIDLATTDEHVDPVLKGHVEGSFGAWNTVPIESAHVRVTWPVSMAVVTQQTPSLPAPKMSTSGAFRVLELSVRGVEPLVAPSRAPVRFAIGRLGEITDFNSWSDVADLMLPLYDEASVVPASGPLRDELEAIRKSTQSPKERVEKALQIVEQRVRYVALEMGTGGLVPAAAETTWARRFGDCKGKTVLLLALLHELGIPSEPVLVHHNLGGILPDRLPMVDYFDHVIVRAHIGGKTYWLDGTRTGDTDLDRIPVVDFKWGLPVIAQAALVPIVPKPLSEPDTETAIAIDARAGAYVPAAFTVEQTIRGDQAIALNTLYSSLPATRVDAALKQYWRGKYDYVDIQSANWAFDQARAQVRLSMTGKANLDWDGGFYVPDSGIAYTPDFSRADGPLHDAPFALDYPGWSATTVKVQLPDSFAGKQKGLPVPVDETVGGIAYQRDIHIDGALVTVRTSQRTLEPELPYKEAIAAAPRLKALYDDDIYLNIPASYRASEADLAALAANKPASASAFVSRGNVYLNSGKYDQAIADFTEAIHADSENVWAIADRGLTYVMKGRTAEAQEDFTAAAAIDPSNYVLLRGRGLMEETSGDSETAIEDFSKSLEGDPGNTFALSYRAFALSNLGRNDEALRDMNLVVSREPENPTALADRAIVELRMGDLQSVDKDVAAALAIDPSNTFALRARGETFEKRGDWKAAVDAYSDALRQSPSNPDLIARRASAYRATGEFDKALADIDSLAKLGPMSPQNRLLRANVLRAMGKHDLVVQEAKLLIEENPKSEYALVAAGKIFAAEGKHEQAIDAINRALAIHPYAYIYLNRSEVRSPKDYAGRLADIEEALKIEPKQPEGLAMKAHLLMLRKDYAGSLAAYDSALADSTGDETLDLRRGRAIALYETGKTAVAEKAFAEIRLQSKGAADLNSLCWDQATAGIMLDEAVEECSQALKLNPKEASYKDSLGMALLRLGKLDEAIRAYSDAIQASSLAESYMGRAFAYLRNGDTAKANADRAAALRRDPTVADRFAEYGLVFPAS